MTNRQLVENYIRFGKQGDYVTNDENNRTITRASSGVNTLPDCYIEQGDICVGTLEFNAAVDFLFGTENNF